MTYSYVEQKAYIENNEIPQYEKLIIYLNINNTDNNLLQILDYLNSLD